MILIFCYSKSIYSNQKITKQTFRINKTTPFPFFDTLQQYQKKTFSKFVLIIFFWNDVFIVNSSVYLPYILHVVAISKIVYQ